MPGNFIWKQNESAYAIFKQYLDRLISVLYFTTHFISDSEMIYNGHTWNYKTGESLKVILSGIRAKMCRIAA